jgi:hypothetical protein
MIRPHRIELGPPPGADWNSCPGIVRRVTYVGDLLACEIEVAGAVFLVERPTQPGTAAPRIGEATPLSWRITDTLAFPRAA